MRLFCSHGSSGSLWAFESASNSHQAAGRGGEDAAIFPLRKEGKRVHTSDNIPVSVLNVPESEVPEVSVPDNLDRAFFLLVYYARKHSTLMDSQNCNAWTLVRYNWFPILVPGSDPEREKILQQNSTKVFRVYAFSGKGQNSSEFVFPFVSQVWETIRLTPNLEQLFSRIRDSLLSLGEPESTVNTICNEISRLLPKKWFAEAIMEFHCALNHNLIVLGRPPRPPGFVQLGVSLAKLIYFSMEELIEQELRCIQEAALAEEMIFFEYEPDFLHEKRLDLGVLDYGHVLSDMKSKIRAAKPGFITAMGKSIKDENERASALELMEVAKNLSHFQKLVQGRGINEKSAAKIYAAMQRSLKESTKNIFLAFKEEYFSSLQHCGCGEDNGLPSLLDYLLERRSFNDRIQSVAFDMLSRKSGKPFCENCNRKVPFFSLLPALLAGLGYQSTQGLVDELPALIEMLEAKKRK